MIAAKRKKDAGNDKVRKPTRCQHCGHERIRLIDERWACYFCGEVQTEEER